MKCKKFGGCKIADLCQNGYFSRMNKSRSHVKVKLVKTQTMKRFVFRLAFAACLLCFSGGSAYPAPAWPHKIMYAQADGTSLAVYVQGDERMHYYVSEDDCVLLPDGKGSLRYAEVSADGRLQDCKMAASVTGYRSTDDVPWPDGANVPWIGVLKDFFCSLYPWRVLHINGNDYMYAPGLLMSNLCRGEQCGEGSRAFFPAY